VPPIKTEISARDVSASDLINEGRSLTTLPDAAVTARLDAVYSDADFEC
jgi:hypothetical protein